MSISLSRLIERMIEDIKDSQTYGWDVEVKVSYRPDLEGAEVLQVEGSPTIRFTLQKRTRDKKIFVDVTPYYGDTDVEDEL